MTYTRNATTSRNILLNALQKTLQNKNVQNILQRNLKKIQSNKNSNARQRAQAQANAKALANLGIDIYGN